MAEKSKIEWTSYRAADGRFVQGGTFNFVRGCTKVSPGCQNCYAERLSTRSPLTLGVWGPDGTRVVSSESGWLKPLQWDRAARRAGLRKRVFCASLADWLEDWDGPMHSPQGAQLFTCSVCRSFARACGAAGCQGVGYATPLTFNDVRRRLLLLICQTPNLDWLLLTKRPHNWRPALEAAAAAGGDAGDLAAQWLYGSPMPNVWVGATVEDQARADERMPHLWRIPAAVRFLSCEPLLGPVYLGLLGTLPERDAPCHSLVRDRIHWVIVGGESGLDARECDLAWMSGLARQCREAKVACFVKQLGRRPVLGGVEHRIHNDQQHGADIDDFPPPLKLRQFPFSREGDPCVPSS